MFVWDGFGLCTTFGVHSTILVNCVDTQLSNVCVWGVVLPGEVC